VHRITNKLFGLGHGNVSLAEYNLWCVFVVFYDYFPRSTYWELFSNELACSMRGWEKGVQSSIIKAYEESCPLKTASGLQNTPYWIPELRSLRKRARKAWIYRLTDLDA
jgi:hypothetical protein